MSEKEATEEFYGAYECMRFLVHQKCIMSEKEAAEEFYGWLTQNGGLTVKKWRQRPGVNSNKLCKPGHHQILVPKVFIEDI